MAVLIAAEYKQFEDIKYTDGNGMEFWYARELAPTLEYTEWRNFSKVIDKAMLSCQNSGFECADHFVEINKMVRLGSGSERCVKDYELSRYACYLIVQNGDPAKNQLLSGKPISPFRLADRKLQMLLIDWMKIIKDLSFVVK